VISWPIGVVSNKGAHAHTGRWREARVHGTRIEGLAHPWLSPGALVVIAAVEGKVPIAVALKAAADHIEPLQPIGELLGR